MAVASANGSALGFLGDAIPSTPDLCPGCMGRGLALGGSRLGGWYDRTVCAKASRAMSRPVSQVIGPYHARTPPCAPPLVGVAT